MLFAFLQKLEKVQSHFNAAQKTCESLKQKCAAALTEQQHHSSLLKAFQVSPVYSYYVTRCWKVENDSLCMVGTW